MTTVAAKQTTKWDELRKKLSSLLQEKIASGKLALPPMPTTAQKVIEALDSGAHNERTARLLEADPTLTLEVLRLANSASFGQRSRVESIAQATTMLGTARLRTLLLTASAQQLFVSPNRTIRRVTATLWAHSVGVATVARQIAVRSGFQDKEAPYLAGLMHDIGKPVIAVHLLELERSVARGMQGNWIDPNEWLGIVQNLHRSVGVSVAKHWNMSDQVCKAIEDCVEYDAVDRLSASNATRFANALAKREGLYAGNFDPEQVETVLLIGRSILGLDDEAVAALVQSLKASAEGIEHSA